MISLFAFFGQQILGYLHISLPALQGAGGLLLLLVALELLTGNEQEPTAAAGHQRRAGAARHAAARRPGRHRRGDALRGVGVDARPTSSRSRSAWSWCTSACGLAMRYSLPILRLIRESGVAAGDPDRRPAAVRDRRPARRRLGARVHRRRGLSRGSTGGPSTGSAAAARAGTTRVAAADRLVLRARAPRTPGRGRSPRAPARTRKSASSHRNPLPRRTPIRSWNSVFTKPGQSVITVTPRGPYSAAAHCAEPVHPRLGGAVGAAREERRDAGDVDDAAVAALVIGPQRGVREPHRGGDEDVEHPLLVVDVVVEEAALEAEPGVVDQQVHRSRRVGEPRLDGGELVAVGRGRRAAPPPSRPTPPQLGGDLRRAARCRGRPAPGRGRGRRAGGRTRGRCRRWRR